MLKELESTAIDDEALVNGELDPEVAAQLWDKRHQATELRRSLIKQRIKLSGSKDVTFLHARPKPSIQDKEFKRVGVYARVSTKSLDQTSSIENQTRYYTEKVQSNPNWELVKVYSDEGKSGTSTKHRTQFLQMIQDARDKKIDLIICASVSRFARNVTECLEQISKLRLMNPSHPVGVYFETENIYTLDDDSDQNLDIHALLADWESRTKSRRMILSVDQRIFTCQFPVSDLLGYRHTKTGKLVMIPEEAKTVRLIFLAFFCGFSLDDIAKLLTEKQRPTLKGRTDWNAAMVKSIMLNERRWGSLQARKTIVIDYKKKKIRKNDNIREGAFVEKHHMGIVSPEIARAVHFILPVAARVEGMQDVCVILKGAMKGFVSVNPMWSAISNETFLDLCGSAYTDTELEELSQENRNATELGTEFEGYQVPYGIYFLNKNMPSLTISRRGLKFNHACHSKLDNCSHVEVLYHPIYQMLILRATTAQTQTSIAWNKADGKEKMMISTKAFSEALYSRMDWIDEYRFQFRGVFRSRGASKILIFNLDEPKILLGKNSNVQKNDEMQETIQYIPYKKESPVVDVLSGEIVSAYPAEWSNGPGLSLYLRQKRDWLENNITEADMRVEGSCAINPMIGAVPSKDQAYDELCELIDSM